MLIPVVCFTCGFPIGTYAAIFDKARTEYIKTKMDGTLPQNILLDASLQIELKDLITALGIPMRVCCRTHLITTLDYRKYY
ncbi:pBA71-CP80R [African swine fever virus]|uniref:DNA-directed RNA polymerase RPB10 homolog n=1 Tax=African swine fever virus TaxID=10497 RepID=A0A0N7CSV1_ASF|nr:pBA71-CP80R [African swine fever virus]AKO62776.1 pBA71-CP80R [African swine fever virus]